MKELTVSFKDGVQVWNVFARELPSGRWEIDGEETLMRSLGSVLQAIERKLEVTS